ncbi:NAD(P)-binding domain-containing protein [Mesorhizobium sp.]|uniref:NAD(P)-binding domain-containing protein n=1 Tax=Mesorhizobium sp. TaxID=1871066 RepID=UPI0025D10616|nr:NAD(P)-binding domain-containing protein [Mesorhizobium sp.]
MWGTDSDGFARSSDVVRFIVDYAAEIEAPVYTGVEVTSLSPGEGNGGYAIETTNGPINAQHVVIATGPFQRPLIPDFGRAIPLVVYQTDTSHYRNAAELPPGSVLVVGTGNSGCQIADELLHSGLRVLLAVSRHRRGPRRYRGKDLMWWLEKLGSFDLNVDTFANRRYPPSIIHTGVNGGYDLDPRRLGNSGVRLAGRVIGASGDTLGFADNLEGLIAAADQSYEDFIQAAEKLADTLEIGSELGQVHELAPRPPLGVEGFCTLNLRDENIRTIIWANGFGYSFDWVKLPILDADGAPVQRQGVTACPGIYFLGLHWMHTFGSGILPFVGRDAAYLADHIDRLGH